MGLALGMIPWVAPAQEIKPEAGPISPSTEVQVVDVLVQKQQYLNDVPTHDQPQNIQTLSAPLIRQIGATDLVSALDLDSGIERQNNFGGLWDSFSVRGFIGDPNVPTAYLVDGFSDGRGFGGSRDTSDIQSIEVLNGPGSALFGRGEPGGTVNLIVKKPQFAPAGSLSQSFGSYDTFRTEGDYTQGVGQHIAFRINGAYETAGSFRDYISSNKWAVSPSVLAKFSDSTTLTYDLQASHEAAPFDRGVVAVNGQLGVVPNSRFFGEPNDGPIEVKVLSNKLQFAHQFNADWTGLLGGGYRDTSLRGYLTQAELTAAYQPFFDNGMILSRERRYMDFTSGDAVFRGELDGRFDTGPIVHHLIVGADDDEFHLNELQYRFRPPPITTNPSLAQSDAVNIFDPVYGNQPAIGPANAITNTHETDREWGVYAQDQIDVTHQVKLRLGLRYDDYDQTIVNLLSHTTPVQTITKVSPQVGLVYEPISLLSLYASYGQGFRPNSGVNVSGVPFSPELTNSTEVGAKLQTADRKFDVLLSVFDTDKSDIITADPANPGFSIAIGKAESTGLELDVDGALPLDVKARLSYTYTDARTTNAVLDPSFARPIPAGAPLLDVPKNSANLLISRDFHFGGGQVASGGVFIRFIDQRLGQTATSFTLPSYTLVKLFASYEPLPRLTVSGFIDNLLNETYYPSSYARVWVQPGEPRSFTLRVSYAF